MKKRFLTTSIISIILTFLACLYFSKYIGFNYLPLFACILFYFLIFSCFVFSIYDCIVKKNPKYILDILTILSGIIMITTAMTNFSTGNNFSNSTTLIIFLVSFVAFFILSAINIRKENSKKDIDLPKVMSEKLTTTSQKNYCVECHCYCTCNADCSGNVDKCTSEKAKNTNCTHCCYCFITPYSKEYSKQEKEES